MAPCNACTAAKAKQKNVLQQSDHVPATGTDRRVLLDIATTKTGPPVTKPNWHLLVDERTNLKFLNFYQTTDGMVEPTCEQFHKWKVNGMPVKYVEKDRAGDYKKLKARSGLSDWKLNLSFEITASDTPQQNHLVKVGHATLANCG